MQKNLTWTFLALAVVLFAFIALFERKTVSTAELNGPQRVFPGTEARNIRAIEVSFPSGGKVRAERTNDLWTLSNPRYPAQQTMLDTFSTNLARLQKIDRLPAHAVALQGQKSFGLENPRASVEFEAGSNRFGFQIGGPAPLTTNVYVRLEPSGDVVVADGSILQALPASTNDWRSPDLIPRPLPFDHLQLRLGARSFEIGRNPTNNLWQITRPIPARADQDRIAALLQQLQGAQVNRFITDSAAADLEKFGLQNPEIEISFARGTNRLFGIEFGGASTNDTNQVYARLIGASNVVAVSRGLVDYLRQPYKNFHDAHLMTLHPALLDRIGIHSMEDFAVQRLTDGRWVVGQNSKLRPCDPELLGQFLRNILSMPIIDIAKEVPTEADLKSLGLATPIASYSFFDRSTNAAGALTNLLFTEVAFGTNQADRIYVRRSDETPIYITPVAQMLELPRRAFELRERQIWQFAGTNVVKIVLKKNESTNFVERTAAGWVNDPIANAAIEEGLFRLGTFKVRAWVAQGSERLKAFAINERSLLLELSVREGNDLKQFQLHFGRATLGRHVYCSTVLPEEEAPTIFEFPGDLYDVLVQHLPVPRD